MVRLDAVLPLDKMRWVISFWGRDGRFVEDVISFGGWGVLSRCRTTSTALSPSAEVVDQDMTKKRHRVLLW